MADSPDPARPAPFPSQQSTVLDSTIKMDPWAQVRSQFQKDVRRDIVQFQTYFQNQLRRYRWARIVVIVSAGLIPVLTVIDDLPKIVLGALGGIAAVTESLGQLYRWRDSAVAAQKSANDLEIMLDLYRTAAPPYDQPKATDAFKSFVVDVERMRQGTGNAFTGIWAEDKPPSAEAQPTTAPTNTKPASA